MTITQVEELLKEASLEYIRHGLNRTEVEFYAKYLLEMQAQETQRMLELSADGFVGK